MICQVESNDLETSIAVLLVWVIVHNFVLKEKHLNGCTNGSWDDQNGKCHKFFSCEEGKGLYCPASRLTLDIGVPKYGNTLENRKHYYSILLLDNF